MPDALLDPDELKPAAALAGRLLDQLDTMLLGRAELPTDMVLYRRISGEAARVMFPGGVRPGTVVIDAGFLSSSRDPEVATRFQAGDPDAMVMVILARAGIRGLDVSAWSATPHEHEVLFARGLVLRVLDYDDETRTLTVEADLD